MISQVNSTIARSVLQEPVLNGKNQEPKISISKQGDTTRIEQLKSSIDDGSYKIDLKALAEKIVKDLV